MAARKKKAAPAPRKTVAGKTAARKPGGRPCSASKVEMTEIIFPTDANPLGNVMGGRVMHWVDICAAVAANNVSPMSRSMPAGPNLV